MSKPNELLPRANKIPFVDYKPAEMRINKDWIIVYYSKNPLTQKLERFRLRVPAMKNNTERTRHGKRIIAEINRKLAEGWSPWMETPGNSFKTFEECCNRFLEMTEKEIEDGIKRNDTLRAYKSYLSMIRKYIVEKEVKITFALEFNKSFAVGYLDWIYYERKNSPNTFNNHLQFVTTFGNFLIERGYIKENPAKEISKKRKQPKKRTVITPEIKNVLAVKLPHFNYNFYCLCMVTYYCMVRRTEITKLKVSDFNLKEDYILISSHVSKNLKDEYVTIPKELKKILLKHFDGAFVHDFAFSADGFKTGAKALAPKKITDTWTMLRKHLGIKEQFQFYSLKDTGITDLFDLGIPSLKIRNQARHYDLKITEMYTPRTMGEDENIKNRGVSFMSNDTLRD